MQIRLYVCRSGFREKREDQEGYCVNYRLFWWWIWGKGYKVRVRVRIRDTHRFRVVATGQRALSVYGVRSPAFYLRNTYQNLLVVNQKQSFQ